MSLQRMLLAMHRNARFLNCMLELFLRDGEREYGTLSHVALGIVP